jgi:arylsulfatase A-like enzyme
MDDQIGRVLDALKKRNMRENTLVIFHSDNGGTRSAKFTGESAVKGELPPDNGRIGTAKGCCTKGGREPSGSPIGPAGFSPAWSME